MQLKYSIFSLQKRLLALIMLVTFVFLVLAGRLIFLQVIKAEELQTLASSQWTRALPIVAKRGDILDTKGSVLATSYTTYDVYVRSKNVVDKGEVASHLSSVLNISYDTVYNKISNSITSEVLIKMQVDENTIKKIVDKNLPGIYISQNVKRYYPYNSLLSKVIGYTTIDGIGQTGLEMYYDKFLQGVDGKSLVESDVKGIELGNTLDTFIPAVDGLTITLTIDANIQLIVENVLAQIMVDHKPKQASAIIMNAKNGEIVAMASLPSLDNNNLPRDDVSTLNALSKNTMIVDVYEPGSTFKILTTAAALNENVTKTTDKFYDSGYKIVDGQKIKCWRTIGHGSETLVEGFCNSCNVVFMELALRLGKEKLYNYLQNFGIGSKTGVDFAGESGGILMNIDSVQNVDLARIGFGQAVAVTPLQLISAVCCAVNGGTLYEPHFVKQIGDTQLTSTIIRKNVVSQETSNTINMMMEEVVSVKGGKESFVEGYRIGGKTGTAQKYENGVIANGKYVSSFIGTYPADNPEYVMLLCVDEPSSGAYYGSVVASPYAKQIFSGMFDYKNIKPSNFVEQEQVTLPNLVGKTISEAYSVLNGLGFYFEVDGEDGIVVSQFPSPDTKLYIGSTILLKLG